MKQSLHHYESNQRKIFRFSLIMIFLGVFGWSGFLTSQESAKHACGAKRLVSIYFLTQSLQSTLSEIVQGARAEGLTQTVSIANSLSSRVKSLEGRLSTSFNDMRDLAKVELNLTYAITSIAILRSGIARLNNSLVAGSASENLRNLVTKATQTVERIYAVTPGGQPFANCPNDID